MNSITSVTFRNLSCEEIIKTALLYNLDGIEWGGDVHVPPDDFENASKVKKLTDEAGLKVTAYGSYFKLGQSKNPVEDFKNVVKTAKILGTKLIRIWAGVKYSFDVNEEERKKLTEELKKVCAVAEKESIDVTLEYHRSTLTDNKESTLRLLKEADCKNLFTSWQPNPNVTYEERINEIKALKEKIACVHVFYWTSNDKNEEVWHELSEGLSEWQNYAKLLSDLNVPHALEFVKGSTVEQGKKDAETLSKIFK